MRSLQRCLTALDCLLGIVHDVSVPIRQGWLRGAGKTFPWVPADFPGPNRGLIPQGSGPGEGESARGSELVMDPQRADGYRSAIAVVGRVDNFLEVQGYVEAFDHGQVIKHLQDLFWTVIQS